MAAPTPDQARRVYLARHGRTALNAAGVLRGRLDPPLDDVGEAEALRLARTLASVGVGAIWTSPLRRACQTASAIADITGAPMTVIDDLADRDYGDWAGHRVDELVDRFGSVDDAPGVEPADAVRRRALATLDAVATLDAKEDGPLEAAAVVLVAHDAVNQLLLRHLAPDLGPPGPRQRTGCFNELRRNGDHWEVCRVDVLPDQGQS